MTQFTKPIRFRLLPLALSFAAAHAAELPKPEITIQGAGFSLAASHPGIVILETKDQQPLTLKPKNEPLVTHAECQTPAGPAKSTTFQWKDDGGYTFTWTMSRLEISRDIYRVYREAVGEDSYILACVGGFNRASFGFDDASRIGTDTSVKIKSLYVGCCLADCINAVGSTGWSNGILFANDPDVTYLRLPENDAIRTWYFYSGLLGGLMMTSEPLASLDAAAIQNLERFIPPAPDKGRAFNGQTDPWHRQFGFIAQRPWGHFASILLWNPADKPADVALAGVPLGPLGGKFHTWSFWDEKYLGIVDENFVAKALPGHGSAQLRLTQISDDRPVLVGSTLHVAMGSAEIKNVESSPDGMTVTLTDAGARQGKLYVVSSKPLSLQSAEGCKASIAPAGENLWCVTLNERLRNTPNVIHLK